MLELRQKLRKTLQRTFKRTLNINCTTYQSTFSQLKCLNKLINTHIKWHTDEQLSKRLQAIRPGPETFRKINQIIGRRTNLPGELLHDNLRVTTNQEKADAFADLFESKFQSYPPHHLPHFLNIVQDTNILLKLRPPPPYTQFSEQNPSIAPSGNDFLTPMDLSEMILSGNSKKSAGTDQIPNLVLKRLPPVH